MDGKVFFAEVSKKREPTESIDAFASRAGVPKSSLYNWKKGTEITSAKAAEVLTKLGFTEQERISITLKLLDPLYASVEPAREDEERPPEDELDFRAALHAKDIEIAALRDEIAALKAEIKRLKAARRR